MKLTFNKEVLFLPSILYGWILILLLFLLPLLLSRNIKLPDLTNVCPWCCSIYQGNPVILSIRLTIAQPTTSKSSPTAPGYSSRFIWEFPSGFMPSPPASNCHVFYLHMGLWLMKMLHIYGVSFSVVNLNNVQLFSSYWNHYIWWEVAFHISCNDLL